jgi:diguanylate cyclase (GGDEF)-like protein
MNRPPTAAEIPRRPFQLTRFFSVASLIGVAVVTSFLFWTYRELTVRHLVEHETRANADLTRAFANAVWHRYRDFVTAVAPRSREALLADPAQAGLQATVKEQMHGLPIAKIKIYNIAGLTVFSTDEKQVGEDKSGNAGLRAALGGAVSSQITFRERFDAFEGVLNNRNLIASYVPIRPAPGAPVEGVFEVYSDVTELLEEQTRAQWQVAAIVVGLLTLLYLFLSLVVRKADRIIAAQVEERAAREAQVRHQAYHDALTGLPNRAYFGERLAETLALAARHRHTCGLMFIDLDRFKIVNDSLGHEAGDLLLKVVSARISESLRGSDLLFRMGGDEFTVILPEIEAPEDAAFVARRVMDAMALPVPVHEHELTVGATIGIAVYPGDGDTGEALLKNADAAMYAAKEAGRGGYAFYRAQMNQRATQRLELEAALKAGFRNGEFELHYQPRVDTSAAHRIVALEALLRWNRPSKGLVLPGEFIGVLEDSGLMPIVGEWVLRNACSQVVRWRDEGRPPLRVSINVSAVQFQAPAFVAGVQRVLRETGAPPELIELELTESLLIATGEQARSTIAALKAMGLKLSIDDFGTGFSSLNYLRHFDVDFLKIDRSFTAEVSQDSRVRAVVGAIIDLADALKIGVVAEGVETEAQSAFYTGAGCGELQGFLFSRPLTVAQLASRLGTGAPSRSATETTATIP